MYATTEGNYAGYDIPFAPGYLATLYPTHQNDIDKVNADVEKLVAQHWATRYDGDWFINQAQAAHLP